MLWKTRSGFPAVPSPIKPEETKEEARLLRASPLNALSPMVAVEARARRVSIPATPPPYPPGLVPGAKLARAFREQQHAPRAFP